MVTRKTLAVLMVSLVVAGVGLAHAQKPTLTTQDDVDIQQLYATYAAGTVYLLLIDVSARPPVIGSAAKCTDVLALRRGIIHLD